MRLEDLETTALIDQMTAMDASDIASYFGGLTSPEETRNSTVCFRSGWGFPEHPDEPIHGIRFLIRVLPTAGFGYSTPAPKQRSVDATIVDTSLPDLYQAASM
ncbi:hypothetical protein [Nocardiopsis sp. CNT312]|uniref:hypothetical protein n=1 Tax=Nocardiopsis sp. CNT312 TaxID=1137268 RepID=UPI000490B1F6|nr:hypothetical protein [Nocardiopsis sp. CNT312]